VVLNRRRFLAAAGGVPFLACSGPRRISATGEPEKRVVVLGLDGLDPAIVGSLIEAGRAPNFKKLAERGAFARLRTTMPALSPVAWSSFITGLTPGGHGIADFIVRDPRSYMPFFSIWEARESARTLSIGDYQLPLSSGKVVCRRNGKPFWAYLTERGIPATVIKIPTNFPVEETATRAVSGMGTPDLIDSFGVFHYFTSDAGENYPDLSGGNLIHITVRDHRADCELYGPVNALKKPKDATHDAFVNNTRVPFRVYRDPDADVVRIDIQGTRLVLKKGDYSDWVRLRFEMIPWLSSVAGIVRFYVCDVHPHLRLYATPINIDPEDQAMPVTHPRELGAELARAIGPFWTKGLPCDTKAFDFHILDDAGYVKQAELLLQEQLALFRYEWSRFRSGLFFFYVSSTDQDAHMLWRNMDKTHPMHKASDPRYAGYLHHLYEEMDKMVGEVLPAADDRTLVLICSDHGFAQFGRQFHLNTWLRDQGYLSLRPEAEGRPKTSIMDIDWERTAAYGVGFNGLYINQEGREALGRVGPGKRADLVERLSRELEAIVDPETKTRPVAKVYRREEVCSGELTYEMPDLLVGYTPGYRAASSSVLGETERAIIDINPWPWSGDHSMACDLVPGCLFSSLPLKAEKPHIWDLPVTILDFFGIDKPEQMVGRSLLRKA
jgi:predicted AlkP superfamily phosphohydrolase/phosphomutase